MAVDARIDQVSQVTNSFEKIPQVTNSFEKITAVLVKYQGKDSEDIIVEVDNKEKTISAKLKSIQYQSVGEFPNVGSENQVYVDMSTNTPYRFDTATLTYIRLGSDWRDIEIIDGGNA